MQNFHNFPTEFTKFVEFYFWPIPHDLKKIHIFSHQRFLTRKKATQKRWSRFLNTLGFEVRIFWRMVFHVWMAGRPQKHKGIFQNKCFLAICFLWWFLLVHLTWATMRFKISMCTRDMFESSPFSYRRVPKSKWGGFVGYGGYCAPRFVRDFLIGVFGTASILFE